MIVKRCRFCDIFYLNLFCSNHNNDACAASDITDDGMCGNELDFEEIEEIELDMLEGADRDNDELYSDRFLKTFSKLPQLERIDEEDENISYEAMSHLSLKDELAAAMKLEEYSEENRVEIGATSDEELGEGYIDNYCYNEAVRSGDQNNSAATTDEEVSQIDTKDYFYSETVQLEDNEGDIVTMDEEVSTIDMKDYLFAEQVQLDSCNEGVPDEENNQDDAYQRVFSDFNDTIPTTLTQSDSGSFNFFSDLNDEAIDELLHDEF